MYHWLTFSIRQWPDYDDYRMSVSVSNHRAKVQSAESLKYLAGRVAFVAAHFLKVRHIDYFCFSHIR